MSNAVHDTHTLGERAEADPAFAARPAWAPKLLAGTMVSTDLDAAQRFYEAAFGFDCVRYARDRLLVRDAYAKAAMEHGSDDFFVIDVHQVPEVTAPHKMCNHWGFDTDSKDEVDRIYAEFKARQDELQITKIMPLSMSHGTYGFYLIDRDQNWWEVQYIAHGHDNAGMFARGDSMEMIVEPGGVPTAKAKRIAPATVPSGVIGTADLTHGTMPALNTEQERHFLSGLLGLNTVRHVKPAMFFAGTNASTGPGNLAVVALGLKMPNYIPMTQDVRWIVHVSSQDEVEQIHERATRGGAIYGDLQVCHVEGVGGEKDLLIRQTDGNWFEITSRSENCYQEIFGRNPN